VRRSFLVGVVAAALWVLAHPQMLGYGGEAEFPGWDVIRVFWADIAFARRAIAGGELPLWNPFDRAGYSFVAEPQSGFFDPVTWVLVLIALLIGSAPAWLITLKSIFYYGIAASGIDAYLRERRVPAWAAGLGVVAFTLCARLDKLKDQSALWPTAWVGWLLFAAHRCIERPDPRRGVWLGLAVSACVLSGYPPTVFRLGLLVFPISVVLLVRVLREAEDPRAHAKALARALAVAGLIVVGLCAAQVQATLSVLPMTERAALQTSEVLATRTRPEHWKGFFAILPGKSPLMVYAGLATAVVSLLALVRVRSAEVWVWFALAVFGFVLAAGHRTPVLPALAHAPGFRSFRIPAHYLLLTSTAVTVLAALGASSLTERSRQSSIWATGITVGALALAVTFTPEADGTRWLLWLFAAGALLALAWIEPRHRRIAGWVVVVAVALDLFAAGRPVATLLRPYPSPERQEQLVERMTEPATYRFADFEWAKNRPGPRVGMRDLLGHRPALTDRRYMMMYEVAPKSGHVLQAMNVELASFKRRDRATRTRSLKRIRELKHVYRVRDPWPIAFFVDHVRVLETPDDVLDALREGGPPAVFLEAAHARSLGPLPEEGSDPIAPVLVSYANNRVVIDVDAPAAGVLVVAESFDPGWRATVDGADAPIVRANLIHRAVPVAAGPHRVELEYAPAGLSALLWLFLLTATGAGVWLWRTSRRAGGRDTLRADA
jgi:hypothetical protein